MPTICPNCLRPVRTDAKYCGYCGSSLTPAHDDGSVALTPALDSRSVKQLPSVKPQTTPSRGKVRRTVLMVIVILLCLVLLIAFFVYYFQLIR
jgi:RNA polymerase subunit RPABC4/transcription elongation factor Spt4